MQFGDWNRWLVINESRETTLNVFNGGFLKKCMRAQTEGLNELRSHSHLAYTQIAPRKEGVCVCVAGGGGVDRGKVPGLWTSRGVWEKEKGEKRIFPCLQNKAPCWVFFSHGWNFTKLIRPHNADNLKSLTKTQHLTCFYHLLLFFSPDGAQTFINLTFSFMASAPSKSGLRLHVFKKAVGVALSGGKQATCLRWLTPQPRDTKEAPGEYNENENQLGYGLWRRRGGFVHWRKRIHCRVRERDEGRRG